MSLMSILYTISDLADKFEAKDPEVVALFRLRQLWFIPFVNPDGYELNQDKSPSGNGMQRKNTRTTKNSRGLMVGLI